MKCTAKAKEMDRECCCDVRSSETNNIATLNLLCIQSFTSSFLYLTMASEQNTNHIDGNVKRVSRFFFSTKYTHKIYMHIKMVFIHFGSAINAKSK